MSNAADELPFLPTLAVASAPQMASLATACPRIFSSDDHNPRRNLSKLRIGPSLGGIAKPRLGKKINSNLNGGGSGGGGMKVPCICSECGKKFGSWKALFGHMRCHPERRWRGMIPPPKFRPDWALHPVMGPDPWLTMTEEDYELAECLLILANSAPTQDNPPPGMEEIHHPDHIDGAESTGDAGSPAGRFECSSCKKVFGSHQALGGHRASHKNVKGCFALMSSISTEFRECGDKPEPSSTTRPATNSFAADTDVNLDLRLGLYPKPT